MSELSDWEEDIASEAEDVKVVKSVDKLPIQTQTKKKGPNEFVIPPELNKPMSDPDAERERIKLIEQARDIAMGGDLFGVEANDEEFIDRSKRLVAAANAKSQAGRKAEETESTSLCVDRLADVEALCNALELKIVSSPAKSQTWLRFLDRMLSVCSAKMDIQDLKTLSRKLMEVQKKQTASRNIQATKAKKGSDLKVNTRNIAAELDIYGGGDDSSHSEDEAEVDAEYADFI